METAYDATAREPVGAEAAIHHHLLMLDYWDYQETMADARDCADVARIYNIKAKLHKHRLVDLKATFPATFSATKTSYKPTAKEIHTEAGDEYHGDDDV